MRIAWNKGLKVDRSKYPTMGHFKQHTTESIAKIKQTKRITTPRGEDAYQWKGKNVGYRALHNWIQKKLGKAKWCLFCESHDIYSHGKKKRYHWANISHEYKRDISDFIPLCVSCHKKYDRRVISN